MTWRPCLVIWFSFLVTSAANASHCTDISGEYSSPWDTETHRTTFSFSQIRCDSLIIVGSTIDNQIASSTVYQPLTVSLDGKHPASKKSDSFGACWGVAPGACAGYLAGKVYIVKTLQKSDPRAVGDSRHGTCFYIVSHLSKDRTGALIEEPQAYACEDGYVGPLAPIVFPPK